MAVGLPVALLLLAASSALAETEHCVQPSLTSTTSAAEGSPSQCGENKTLNEYLSSPEAFFTSDAIFYFLPGVHYMNQTLSVRDVVNLRLTGANAVVQSPVQPTGPITIELSNVSGIVIEGLNISTCVPCSPNTGVLSFQDASDVIISQSSVENVCGGNEIVGKDVTILTLSHSTFSKVTNSAGIVHCPGVYIEGLSETAVIKHSHFSFPDSNFGLLVHIHNDKNTFPLMAIITDSQFTCGAIEMTSSSAPHETIVVLHNTILKGCNRESIGSTFGVFLTHFANNVTITNSSVSNYSSGLIMIFPSRANLLVENCTISNNYMLNLDQAGGEYGDLSHLNFPVATGMTAVSHSNMSAIIRNVTFKENQYRLPFTIRAFSPAVLLVFGVFNFIDCSFLDGRGGALYLDQSQVVFSGKNVFVNNIGFRGGAVFLTDNNNCLQLTDEASVHFESNSAEDTGGAIYIDSSYSLPAMALPSCFISQASEQARMIFTNNTAWIGGDAIFGGDLDEALTPERNRCITLINKISHFSLTPQISNLSLISSSASRVCFCENGFPNCEQVFKTISVYPGQRFYIPAVVVGQHFGTVSGSIYAQFLTPPDTASTSTLGKYQGVQMVGQHECGVLHYNVFTLKQHEVLVLTSTAANVFNFPNPTVVNRSIEEYIINNHSYVPKYLLKFPLYINISFKRCPPGFELTEDENPKCGCNAALKILAGPYRCDCHIDTQRIEHEAPFWVSALSDNSTNKSGIVYTTLCPYDYCKMGRIELSLDNPEEQCQYNHSGTLCGQCPTGLSLPLGGLQCQSCSNVHLVLIIPFALAGILLVIVIKVGNLTVAVGLINGIIFYANMLKCNDYGYFDSGNTFIKILEVFIAWLNLDLGIETCFFDGLDGYWKTWLQFVFPIYIWTIAIVMILLARYSMRMARLLGNNSVPVLATLFTLSYAKLFSTIITTLNYTTLVYPEGEETVWSYDGSIGYLGVKHGLLFIAAIVVLLLLFLPYTMILFFGQWLLRFKRFNKVKPIFDAHYGPFKDKHRYWFGMLLVARATRLVVSVMPTNDPNVSYLSTIFISGILIAYLLALGKHVYRKWYVSVSEVLFLLNTLFIAASALYTTSRNGDQSLFTGVLVGTAFLQFVVIITFSIFKQLEEYKKTKYLLSHLRFCVMKMKPMSNLHPEQYQEIDLQISHRQSGEY